MYDLHAVSCMFPGMLFWSCLTFTTPDCRSNGSVKGGTRRWYCLERKRPWICLHRTLNMAEAYLAAFCPADVAGCYSTQEQPCVLGIRVGNSLTNWLASVTWPEWSTCYVPSKAAVTSQCSSSGQVIDESQLCFVCSAVHSKPLLSLAPADGPDTEQPVFSSCLVCSDTLTCTLLELTSPHRPPWTSTRLLSFIGPRLYVIASLPFYLLSLCVCPHSSGAICIACIFIRQPFIQLCLSLPSPIIAHNLSLQRDKSCACCYPPPITLTHILHTQELVLNIMDVGSYSLADKVLTKAIAAISISFYSRVWRVKFSHWCQESEIKSNLILFL